MKIIFVLVEPQRPANIGASARALHTMGFDTLRLVNPCDYTQGEAQWLAHGSLDILRRITVYADLAEAVADADLVIGTSARKRRYRFVYQSSRALPRILADKGDSAECVAMVFGKESTGLSNAALELCDFVSTIPAATAYPSLNLAQAVMIYAYELSRNQWLQSRGRATPSLPARTVDYQHLKRLVGALFAAVGIAPERPEYRQAMERLALLNRDDLQLVQFLRQRVLEALGQGTAAAPEKGRGDDGEGGLSGPDGR